MGLEEDCSERVCGRVMGVFPASVGTVRYQTAMEVNENVVDHHIREHAHQGCFMRHVIKRERKQTGCQHSTSKHRGCRS